MAFGPLSVIEVLAGSAWLASQAIGEINGTLKSQHRNDSRQKFVNEYSDIGLELKIEKYINNPQNQNEIYDYLELFKRNNHRWCYVNEVPVFKRRETNLGKAEYYKASNEETIDWYNVGKKRLTLSSDDNINMATQMVANSLGVWTRWQASLLFDAGVSAKLMHQGFPTYCDFIGGVSSLREAKRLIIHDKK